jgi:hypothetical protein
MSASAAGVDGQGFRRVFLSRIGTGQPFFPLSAGRKLCKHSLGAAAAETPAIGNEGVVYDASKAVNSGSMAICYALPT